MSGGLAIQLIVSAMLVLATVAIHAVGLIILSRTLGREAWEEAERHIAPRSFGGVTMVVALVAGLFLLHGLGSLLCAPVFRFAEAVPGFDDPISIPAMSYGTAGCSCALLDPRWRLVAAIGGINGLILIGSSTAFFIALMGRGVR